MHQVDLIGAKAPFNYFCIKRTPEGVGEWINLLGKWNSLMFLVTGTSGNVSFGLPTSFRILDSLLNPKFWLYN